MTSQQQTAAAIAGRLTAGEKQCLSFQDLNQLSTSMFTQLFEKGLVYKTMSNGKLSYHRTDLGNLVLAALEAPQAKPDVISAREFVEQGFAEKVAKGECVVTDLEGNNVISMSTEKDFNDVYAVLVETLEIPVNGWVDEYSSDAKFSVTWLDTATPPQAESGAGWYISSVAQWIPEYFTEKPMNYDGPFDTWQKALEFLFKELDEDFDKLRAKIKDLQFAINKLDTLVPDSKPRDTGNALWEHGYECALWDIGYTVRPLSTRKEEMDGVK